VGDMLTAWRQTKDFLRDRLVTSGRSDVSINAVLRVMNSAFDDERPDSLDAAWAEAEAALPEGWQLRGVERQGVKWLANADEPRGAAWNVAHAYAETPAAVLRALAAKLREVGR